MALPLHPRACGVSQTECVTSPAGFPRASTGGASRLHKSQEGRGLDGRTGLATIHHRIPPRARRHHRATLLPGQRLTVCLAGRTAARHRGHGPRPGLRFSTHPSGTPGRRLGRSRPFGRGTRRGGPARPGAAGAGRSGRTPRCLGERRGGLRGHVPAGGHAPAPDAGGDPACAAARRRARGAGALPVRALPVRDARLGAGDGGPARRTPAVAQPAGPRPTCLPSARGRVPCPQRRAARLHPGHRLGRRGGPAGRCSLPARPHRPPGSGRQALPREMGNPGRRLELPLRRVVAELPTDQP